MSSAGAGAARPLAVGLVGATGNVGTAMLQVLAERGVAISSLRAFASPRSAGSTLAWAGAEVVVEDLATADPAGLDVALFSAGAQRALDHAPRFAETGCVVIDNSSAFRMHDDVPLVVPEVNAHALANVPRGIIANPNCSTIQLVCVLEPIRERWGLERVQVTTMQSTSGTGKAAMDELRAQAGAALDPDGGDAAATVYPHPIAFNVLPHCDSFLPEGDTKEERKLVDESRKILGEPSLRLGATCTRVPVFVGHSEAVHLELGAPASADEVRELLRCAPGVVVADAPAANVYPLARAAAGRDEVFVGRIRRDASVPGEHGIALFIVADNLRKGAATNAVQVLEALVTAGRFETAGQAQPAG